MKKNRLLNGVVFIIISQAVVKVFGLLYKLYLANKEGFGDSGNAIYNAGFQIYALLLTVSSIGVPNAVAKLVAEKYYLGDKESIGNILKTALILFSIIGMFFSVIMATSSGYISNQILEMEETKNTIIALSPAIFNVCLISVYRGFYNGIKKIEITAKSQSIEQILKTIFTVTLVEIAFYTTKKNTVIMASVANLATSFATFMCVLYLFKKNKFFAKKSKFSSKIAIRTLKYSIPISLSSILVSLNKNIDSATVVRYLKKYIGEHRAKIEYGILSGKVDVIASLPISFIIAIAITIIPNISRFCIKSEKNKIANVTNTYILFTLLLVIPCAAGMISFSNNIMILLFDNSNGSILLKVSAISMIFVAIEQVLHAVLQGIGRVFIPTFSLLVGVFIKIALNILLIKNFNNRLGGTLGACLSTLVCHAVACSISYFFLKRSIKFNINYLKFVIKPMIATIGMLFVLNTSFFLFNSIISIKIAIIISILLASFSYVIFVLLLKILDENELKLLPFSSAFNKF